MKNTTVNGKEVLLSERKDIEEKFSKIVAEYLGQGYFFNSKTSNGTQGEILKAHLSNDGGKTVIVVFVDRFTPKSDCFRDGLKIYVKKYENADRGRTLWLKEGETISEDSFFCINDYYGENPLFANSKEVFDAIEEQRKERWYKKHVQYVRRFSQKANRYGYRLLKKHRGYSNVKMSEIEYVEKRGSEIWVKPANSYAVKVA